jgi:hypothetical protein
LQSEAVDNKSPIINLIKRSKKGVKITVPILEIFEVELESDIKKKLVRYTEDSEAKMAQQKWHNRNGIGNCSIQQSNLLHCL